MNIAVSVPWLIVGVILWSFSWGLAWSTLLFHLGWTNGVVWGQQNSKTGE